MYYIACGPSSDRPGREGHMIPSQSEYDNFYIAYGEALGAWANVEHSLSSVFEFHISSNELLVSHAVFWSLQGFRARLDVTTAAVESSGRSPDAIEEWRKISTKLSRKSKSRNKLAHFSPCFGREKPGRDYRMFLGDPKSPFSGSIIRQEELKEWTSAFINLSHETSRFFHNAIKDGSD
ncbi:MAG TPA: hypothetical protein DEH24_18680 [Alteromonas sp.]|nr:hypothetical protein [Alteromonadaceae bacterium]MAX41421.1 hypothetical protein [Alteromonadaceae bacterium]HBY41463.1 hypothetical protein [Alteromonas sp.]|tara:strand:+ start:198 stop:734 length:537 start_codon:yes stop_codon:yes gene_type:complete